MASRNIYNVTNVRYWDGHHCDHNFFIILVRNSYQDLEESYTIGLLSIQIGSKYKTVGPTRENLVLDPLAVLHLNNQL